MDIHSRDLIRGDAGVYRVRPTAQNNTIPDRAEHGSEQHDNGSFNERVECYPVHILRVLGLAWIDCGIINRRKMKMSTGRPI